MWRQRQWQKWSGEETLTWRASTWQQQDREHVYSRSAYDRIGAPSARRVSRSVQGVRVKKGVRDRRFDPKKHPGKEQQQDEGEAQLISTSGALLPPPPPPPLPPDRRPHSSTRFSADTGLDTPASSHGVCVNLTVNIPFVSPLTYLHLLLYYPAATSVPLSESVARVGWCLLYPCS